MALAYRCLKQPNPNACGSNQMDAALLEGEVITRLLIVAKGLDVADIRRERTETERGRLVTAIADDEAQLEQLADDHGARLITRSEWFTARQPVLERLSANEAQLAQLGGERLPPDLVSVTEESFQAMTFDEKRSLLALFVSRITVAKSPTPGHFIPERISITWRA
jgi:hypothetical protein